ncbi:MAG: hypothetical protein M3M88_07590, partial [Thermoproteota archaeon]|nr:hypothetical protein [Thermoproteota archaeon]
NHPFQCFVPITAESLGVLEFIQSINFIISGLSLTSNVLNNIDNGKVRLNYSDILEKNLALYLCQNIDNGTDLHYSSRHINTSLYFIDYSNNLYADNPFFQHMDYSSKKFIVYNLTGYACDS